MVTRKTFLGIGVGIICAVLFTLGITLIIVFNNKNTNPRDCTKKPWCKIDEVMKCDSGTCNCNIVDNNLARYLLYPYNSKACSSDGCMGTWERDSVVYKSCLDATGKGDCYADFGKFVGNRRCCGSTKKVQEMIKVCPPNLPVCHDYTDSTTGTPSPPFRYGTCESAS